MTYATKTNNFFKEKVYPNLFSFAFSPVSWMFNDKSFDLQRAMPFAHYLIAATIATSAIAFCLAVISAVLHAVSLVIATIVDACTQPQSNILSAN